MPYIKKESRTDIDEHVDNLAEFITTEGELNYAITTIVHNYMKRNGGIRYSNINEVIGTLECAKLELYRRLAGPYEDIKIDENGDVSLNEK